MRRAAITGHQEIGDQETIQWVTSTLRQLILDHEIGHGYTALAAGADQIFADCLLTLSIPYTVTLPCTRYEETFKKDCDLQNFRRLRKKAASEVKLAFELPSEDAFYEAGRCVIDHAELVFAVWNGRKAKGKGGTGDAVAYALELNKTVVHIDNINKTVEVLAC